MPIPHAKERHCRDGGELLRMVSIWREALVVVSVGALMTAAALLPRVVGEPNHQHFALPPLPATRSANVSAPIFAPPPPRVERPRKPTVPSLADNSLVSSPTSFQNAAPRRTRIAHVEHPSETKPRAATPRPQPVVEPKSVTVSLKPAVPVVPAPVVIIQPRPEAPPATIVQPTPTPQTAPTVAPTVSPTIVVGVSPQTTVSAQQPAEAPTSAALEPPTPEPQQSGRGAHSRFIARPRLNCSAQQQALTAVGNDDSGRGKPHTNDGSDKPHKNDLRFGPTGTGDAAPTTPSSQQAFTTTVETSTSSPSIAPIPPPTFAPGRGKGRASDPTIQPTVAGPPPGLPPQAPSAPQPADPQQFAPPQASAPGSSRADNNAGGPSGTQGHGRHH